MTVNDRVVDVYSFEYVGRRLRINVMHTEEIQLDGLCPSPPLWVVGIWNKIIVGLSTVVRSSYEQCISTGSQVYGLGFSQARSHCAVHGRRRSGMGIAHASNAERRVAESWPEGRWQ